MLFFILLTHDINLKKICPEIHIIYKLLKGKIEQRLCIPLKT